VIGVNCLGGGLSTRDHNLFVIPQADKQQLVWSQRILKGAL